MRFLAPLVFLAACFSPQIDDGKFGCRDNACPSGFTCASCDQLCYRDPNHQCQTDTPDSPITIDANLPPPVDAAMPDVPITMPDAPPMSADAPVSMLDAPLPPDGAVQVDAIPGAPDAKPTADAPPPDAPSPPDASPPDAPSPPIDAGPQPDAPFCGDGTCQAWLGENCDNCKQDCKACALTCTLQLGCGTLGNNCINCPSLCGDCVCNFMCTAADQTFCPTDCPP